VKGAACARIGSGSGSGNGALARGYAIDDGGARRTLDRLLGLCWGLTH
jgi:hypothetical protein